MNLRPDVETGFVQPTLGGFAHEILPALYLGPHDCCTGVSTLSELTAQRITAIVNCSINSGHSPSIHKDTIKYCEVSIHDNEGASILPWLMPVTDFIHREIVSGGKCLVHCQMGISRSSSIVIAYLMRYHNMTRDKAYVFTKMRRPQINPNCGFWEQLLTFQANLEKGQDNTSCTSLNSSTIESKDDADRFGDDWIQSSFITFSTLYSTGGDCPQAFEKLEQYRDHETVAKTSLKNGLYFVLGSGLNKVEMAWFCALVKVYSVVFPGVTTSSTSSYQCQDQWSGIEEIARILETEQFQDEWGSDFRPRDEKYLMKTLNTVANS